MEEQDPNRNPAPQLSLWSIFISFSKAGLLSFGGAVPLVRKLVVDEKNWLNDKEFVAILGICQFVPGPNAVNVALFVGSQLRGAAGAAAACAGILGGPLAVALFAAAAFDRWGSVPLVAAASSGMIAAGSGLLLTASIKLAQGLDDKPVWLPFAAVALMLVGLAGAPMLMAVPALALAGFFIAQNRMRSKSAAAVLDGSVSPAQGDSQ